jgi:Domain of unknown function (DUF1932)
VAEMEEIAETMAAAGLPDGFHQAAAEVYRRVQDRAAGDAPAADAPDALDVLDSILTALLSSR